MFVICAFLITITSGDLLQWHQVSIQDDLGRKVSHTEWQGHPLIFVIIDASNWSEWQERFSFVNHLGIAYGKIIPIDGQAHWADGRLTSFPGTFSLLPNSLGSRSILGNTNTTTPLQVICFDRLGHRLADTNFNLLEEVIFDLFLSPLLESSERIQAFYQDDVVFQGGERDCGLAAMEMFIDKRELGVPSEALRVALESLILAKGLTLKDMKQFLEKYGYSSHAWRANYSQLRGLDRPVILHFKYPHYVLLIKAFEQAVLILDPAKGRHLVPISRFGELWSGIYFDLSAQ